MFMDKVVDLFLNDSSTRKKWELVVLVAMFWSISVLKTIMLEQGSRLNKVVTNLMNYLTQEKNKNLTSLSSAANMDLYYGNEKIDS